MKTSIQVGSGGQVRMPGLRLRASRTGCLSTALLLMVACTTTPADRVAKHPERFAQFDPETQEQILTGQVALGFTPEMTYLALGEPDRKVTRTTEAGITERWIYLGYHTRTSVREPSWPPTYDWYYDPVRKTYVRVRSPMPDRHRYETFADTYVRMTVSFREERVVAFEHVDGQRQ